MGYTQEHVMQVLFLSCAFGADTIIGVLMGCGKWKTLGTKGAQEAI